MTDRGRRGSHQGAPQHFWPHCDNSIAADRQNEHLSSSRTTSYQRTMASRPNQMLSRIQINAINLYIDAAQLAIADPQNGCLEIDRKQLHLTIGRLERALRAFAMRAPRTGRQLRLVSAP